jgi:hypothetical protein
MGRIETVNGFIAAFECCNETFDGTISTLKCTKWKKPTTSEHLELKPSTVLLQPWDVWCCNQTVDGLNFSPKHIGMKPSKAHFSGVPMCAKMKSLTSWISAPTISYMLGAKFNPSTVSFWRTLVHQRNEPFDGFITRVLYVGCTSWK